MDAITATSLPSNMMSEGSTLNSPAKIIIKKENIGLEEYQHKKYQFNLFNNDSKHDQYYEDLVKVKDRLEKTAPSMQQVIQLDMKRVNINKVYERKLSRDLTGPRGLDWQRKQELQRLESDEREAERDLMRLNRDLARPSMTSLFSQQGSTNSNKDSYSRSQTPRLSLPNVSFVQQKADMLIQRSISINPNRTSIDRMTPINQKRLSLPKRNSINLKSSLFIHSKTNETHLRQHVNSINQEKREIEQKLKEFLH